MKTNQEQILEALSGLIPEDAQSKVSTVISQFLDSAYNELHAKMEENCKQAYEEHKAELKEAERIAEEGYAQSWEIITDLRDRLEVQKEEFDHKMEDEFEQAYQMLQEERAKNDTLEVNLYEEYDRKFEDIKNFMVDKIDEFLQLQGDKYEERIRKDVVNDPATVEHRLAFDRVVEVVSNYLTEEETAFATSSKVDTLHKQLEDVKGQMKILEGKNFRLSMENNKLNEAVRYNQEVINEQVVRKDKKARLERAKKVEGRGASEADRQRQVVIGEYNTGEPVAEQDSEDFAEQVGESVFADWKHLSGLTKPDNGEE